MYLLSVDADAEDAHRFETCARALPGIDALVQVSLPSEALAYAVSHPVDVVFLDITLPEMDGIALAHALQAQDPSVRVFFLTDHTEYALAAFSVDALGFLVKPCTVAALSHALARAERMRPYPRKRVYIRTIPRFDVFVDGVLLPLSSPKPKELLALLVDHNGSAVTAGQAIACLWENRPSDSNAHALYRMTCKRLRDLLAQAGIDFILGQSGSLRYVRPDTFSCDYYDLLRGVRQMQQLYNHDYMSEYTWAEDSNARIAALLKHGHAGAL